MIMILPPPPPQLLDSLSSLIKTVLYEGLSDAVSIATLFPGTMQCMYVCMHASLCVCVCVCTCGM